MPQIIGTIARRETRVPLDEIPYGLMGAEWLARYLAGKYPFRIAIGSHSFQQFDRRR